MKNKKDWRIKDVIKAVLFVLFLIGAGLAWYFFDDPEIVDPQVHVEASEVLKTLDATKAEAKDCAGLLKMERQFIEGYATSKNDPAISVEQKTINERKLGIIRPQYDKDKIECEPKIVEYEKNLNRYRELAKILKDDGKVRYIKMLENRKQDKNMTQEENLGFSFEYEYSLKYVLSSDRFRMPE